MAPCRFFAHGSCLYGASCKNSHDVPAPAASASSTSEPRDFAIQESLQRTPREYTSPKKASCWFNTQGKCKYGASCKNIHDLSPLHNSKHCSLSQQPAPRTAISTNSCTVSHKRAESKVALSLESLLKPEAPSFMPKFEVPVIQQREYPKIPIPCKFFASGFCSKDKECQFLHAVLPQGEYVPSADEKMPEQQAIAIDISGLSTQDDYSQDMNGARVIYGTGAGVLSVKLASDVSRVQISGLAPDAKPPTVCKLLSELGYPTEESQVILKNLGEIGIIAEVRTEDPSFAKDVARKWEQVKTEMNKNVSIKPMVGTSGNGPTGNRLQLSTITCSWYQASRIACLKYHDKDKADKAMEQLGENRILDRVPDCSLRGHHARFQDSYYTVQVSNLHGKTTRHDINRVFRTSRLYPADVTLYTPNHEYSDSEAAEIVRGLLQRKGELESFQHQSVPGSNKVKATATFVDRDIAAEAVRDLHNTHVAALGRTKIFINHVVSVKYNVPTSIASALKKELDKLGKDIWRSGHVHLKTYPPTDPSKSFTAMRLFGENLKSVSGAKAQLEKLLAGIVVMSGDTPLWDPYFLKSTALTDLNELGRTHKLLVYRDARKSQILMFGGSVDVRNAAQRALIEKVETFRKLQHTIILSPQLLKKAMQGGMRRLKGKFGQAITLNVALNPKIITFTGSEEDFQQAQALLVDLSHDHEIGSSAQMVEDCVVCWTEATDPLHTACAHTYCKDCFASQASSSGENDIPLHCFGSEGKCEHVFSIEELKAMLSFTDFESLLQNSFKIHIHTRPKEFQYCPTPDCPQVYRLTNTGETFLCSACLTPICTKCNVISHDGMTCEEYKEMDSEENKLFQEYKKEHDVRDCPNCKVGIQKSEGCNHMECMRCGTHICWFCMKTFEASQGCYSHMKEVHGDYYDPGFWDN